MRHSSLQRVTGLPAVNCSSLFAPSLISSIILLTSHSSTPPSYLRSGSDSNSSISFPPSPSWLCSCLDSPGKELANSPKQIPLKANLPKTVFPPLHLIRIKEIHLKINYIHSHLPMTLFMTLFVFLGLCPRRYLITI